MATLREYFDTDFAHVLNAAKTLKLQFEKSSELEVRARLHLDFNANAKYISCFIPNHAVPIAAFVTILQKIQLVLALAEEVHVEAGYVGEEPVYSQQLVFTGRIYFYSETDIPNNDFEELRRQALTNGLSICLRTQSYASERSKLEKPLAFICHDTRDKAEVARPIAIGLSGLMCPVWYDEFTLEVGDRLRESIESGLKQCKKCVLVLSSNFFSNTGWTRAEFDSIFTRELVENKDFLLPVWFGVTQKQVFEYSPSLANRVAIDWGVGEKEVLRRLHRKIR